MQFHPVAPLRLLKWSLAVLVSAFVCKGLQSLFPAVCLQRTAERVPRFCCKGLLSLFLLLFANDCCPCFLLFVSKECRPCFCHLSLFYSFNSKECCSCFLLLVCKETVVLVFTLLSAKDWCPGKSTGDCCPPPPNWPPKGW